MAPLPSASPNILRSKAALKDGDRVYDFLRLPEQRALMRKGADDGAVVVSYLSGPLIMTFPDIDFSPFPLRQFIGALTKAVLEEEGYEVAVRGVKVPNDPIFSKGSRYRRREVPKTPAADDDNGQGPDWMERIVAVLTLAERVRMAQLLAAQGVS